MNIDYKIIKSGEFVDVPGLKCPDCHSSLNRRMPLARTKAAAQTECGICGCIFSYTIPLPPEERKYPSLGFCK